MLPDTDEDGIPDDYETANGLDPADGRDGALDRDGDRSSNLEEYLAGTDLSDPASVLRLDIVAYDRNQRTLTFQAIADRSYEVKKAPSPDALAWGKIIEVAAQPTNSAVTVFDTTPADGGAFYQLVSFQATE